MKTNRLRKNILKEQAPVKPSMLQADQAVGVRGVSLSEAGNTEDVGNHKKISEAFSECFSEEVAGVFRLEEEFEVSLIDAVVGECRSRITENSMKREDWEKLGGYLAESLWEFSRLKEDLVMTERKCGMVQQKANQASQPVDGKVNKSRIMACAMLLAEVEMRRDHFKGRISLIVDAFVKRILNDFEGVAGYDVMELRLRAVFGAL